MRFTKMEGCGNDYVYLDCFAYERPADPSALAVKVSDRHFGIGSDGLILICPSDVADCRMEMYNADGSQSEMCGNGVRCVGKYAYDHNIAHKDTVTVETLAGIKTLALVTENDICLGATVDMGAPVLDAPQIPTTLAESGAVIDMPLRLTDTLTVNVTCVSMGNPHATVIVDDADSYPVETVGPLIENHPAFPRRINAHFISRDERGGFRIRTWERGAGETLACGTGNCAALVAAQLLGLCGEESDMYTSGGLLHIRHAEGESVFMTGPAREVYNGEINMSLPK